MRTRRFDCERQITNDNRKRNSRRPFRQMSDVRQVLWARRLWREPWLDAEEIDAIADIHTQLARGNRHGNR